MVAAYGCQFTHNSSILYLNIYYILRYMYFITYWYYLKIYVNNYNIVYTKGICMLNYAAAYGCHLAGAQNCLTSLAMGATDTHHSRGWNRLRLLRNDVAHVGKIGLFCLFENNWKKCLTNDLRCAILYTWGNSKKTVPVIFIFKN